MVFVKIRLILICLLFYGLLLAGCDNASLDDARGFLGLDKADPGVVATVNGSPILLGEIQSMSDMSNSVIYAGQSVTLEDIWANYADSLYLLIVQELVHQDILTRGMHIDEKVLLDMETVASFSYGELPGPDFDAILEGLGLDPVLWRKQLKARLEMELLQEELAKAYIPKLEEVDFFLKQHPELAYTQTKLEILQVGGEDKAQAEAALKRREINVQALQQAGLQTKQYSLVLDGNPSLLGDELQNKQAGDFSSKVWLHGQLWSYLAVLDRSDPIQRTPAELFMISEKMLVQEKILELFDAWIEDALSKSEIRIVSQFLPKNVPVSPEPMVYPWMSVQRSEDSGESVGEVEGEDEGDGQ